MKGITIIIIINLIAGSNSAQNYLNGPECVSYDSLSNRYIVSNWTNGNVIEIDSSGNQSFFTTGLGHAYGNFIKDSTVYISNGTSILGLNLFNPLDTIVHIQVPSASQMDGITIDDNNNIYAVDVIQALIFKINLLTLNPSIFVTGLSSRPQDVIFDKKNNRLLTCSWYGNSPIQAISLIDSSVTDLVTTIYGNCDGLAMDEYGNVYFSTWANNSVYFYDSTFTNPPTKLSGTYNGPSNICFNRKNNIIAVPNFNSNELQLVQIDPTLVIKGNSEYKIFKLQQNYPNPFNPTTVISYQLPVSGNAAIKVYDILGNEIETLVDEYKPAGKYEVEFNESKLANGIYFYQLQAGNFIQTKKMVLIK
jgi:hypothetical protein